MSATKPATAAAATASDVDFLPREQTQGSVHFLSGGVGIREAVALRHAMGRFPLTLEFRNKANAKGQSLADVPVTIRIATGQVVLKTLSTGPFLLASVRPGKYEIMAEWRGERQQRQVEVRANGGERLVFEWNIA